MVLIFPKDTNGRADNLKKIKKGLNYLKTKITYTNDTLPNIFFDIHNKLNGDVGELFLASGKRMELEFAGEAWEKCIDSTRLILSNEDKDVLKSLGKLLGSTDIDGQINQIDMVNNFLDEQINEAMEQKNKNEKMYKKLGIIIGLGIVIILV